MGHNPDICTICSLTDRVTFDSQNKVHFVPHDSKNAFPLFRLYPVQPESV
jgi:hypothetical protein